jgi:tripartite-type tricarboxylate transporter receptor subunit TctC
VVSAVQNSKVRSRIVADGGEPVANTPEEFTRILHADYKKWGEVVRKAGIRVDQR